MSKPARVRQPRHESPGDLTAREIAQRLKTRWPDIGTTVIRVRHWTQLGLLQASNARFPGRGKQREYQSDIVVDVAVLGALADLGMPLVAQKPRYLRYGLGRARAAFDRWLNEQKPPQFYLSVSHIAGDRGIGPTPEIHEGAPTIAPAAEATITINLTQLFQRIGRHR